MKFLAKWNCLLRLIVRKLKITIYAFSYRFKNNVDRFFGTVLLSKRDRFIIDFSTLHGKEQFSFASNTNVDIHLTFPKTCIKIKCLLRASISF